jgi:hypothetical protein
MLVTRETLPRMSWSVLLDSDGIGHLILRCTCGKILRAKEHGHVTCCGMNMYAPSADGLRIFSSKEFVAQVLGQQT